MTNAKNKSITYDLWIAPIPFGAFSISVEKHAYSPKYAGLQLQLDQAITNVLTKTKGKLNIELDWFQPKDAPYKVPKSAYKYYDPSYQSITTLAFPVIFAAVIPFVYFPLMSLSQAIITSEKRQHLLVPLRRMGLNESVYWLSSITLMVPICILVGLLSACFASVASSNLGFAVFSRIDLGFVFLISSSYALGLCAVGLVIASCFSRPLWVNICQGIVGITFKTYE